MQTGMQVFHRGRGIFKVTKYLLITGSFPHSPQVFPQGLSTGSQSCEYSFLVHIISGKRLRQISHFFGSGGFYHGEKIVQKFGLDSRRRQTTTGSGQCRQLDFLPFPEGDFPEDGYGGMFLEQPVQSSEKTEEIFKIGG